MSESTLHLEDNRRRAAMLEQVLAQLCEESQRRGFFGTLGVEIDVKDGVILTVRRVVNQQVR